MRTGRGYRQLFICALVAAMFPLLAWLESKAPTDADYKIVLPSRVDGAASARRRERTRTPTYHGATRQVRDTYGRKGTLYDVLTINYASQEQGAELIFGQNT